MRNIRLYFGFIVINLIKCFLNIGYFYDKLLIYIICDLNIWGIYLKEGLSVVISLMIIFFFFLTFF